MWTPNDFMAVFDHCSWQVFFVLFAVYGLQILISIFFHGGEDE